jgi:hypothetical protein
MLNKSSQFIEQKLMLSCRLSVTKFKQIVETIFVTLRSVASVQLIKPAKVVRLWA